MAELVTPSNVKPLDVAESLLIERLPDRQPADDHMLHARDDLLCVFAVILTLMGAPLDSTRAQAVQGAVVSGMTGTAIEGASVDLLLADSTRRRVGVTDKAGRFRIGRVPVGEHIVLVRRIGFAPSELTVRIETGKAVEVRLQMQPIPRLLDTVRTRADDGGLTRLTSGSEWYVQHIEKGKGYFTSGNEVLLTRMDACDYLARIPGLLVQRVPPVRGEPGLQCHDDRYIVAAATSRCLRTFVDRHRTISQIDSAGLWVRTHEEEKGALFERRRRRGLPALDTMPSYLPLTAIAGIEIFRNKSELPKDFSIPIPTGTDPDLMMLCGYMLVWTWTAW